MDSANIFDQQLDARGLHCPLPLLKAKQRLNAMQPGQLLLVQASDPGSWEDFASYAELSSHTLVSREQLDDTYQFVLRRGD
ncbi:sulfurtransferase TusA family protein [Marinospirillum alkaliphilum]|uniref:tRNA 2-thiouridine synthesizing protein A n=1 Tax=Marinospirillum alkaliphilum DSM 21637 TaxID=1122209 RepID=A0A1K1W195_9GAMM|nr:sulfurtransferase TusA family protein [Marinospirillum alkaliphilum]SFX30676.1 tRNA 2-thiouridine synthesizing protein A [Marinospirillum alkaliphilum DSM 21637]